MFKKLLSTLTLGLGLLCAVSPAVAAYPERGVRIIVPYVPGGVNDVVARVVAQELSTRWSKSVTVENRAGASGMIAAKLAVAAAPDGYTLILAPSTFAAHPALFPQAGYSLTKDLTPIVQMVGFPVMVISSPKLKFASVTEMINHVKGSREPVSYASGGNASTPHMAAEWLKFRSGAMGNLAHIPYKGDSDAILAVLNGSVSFAFTSFLAALPHVKSGAVNAVAVTSLERAAQLPEGPTVAESGVPGYEMGAWVSLMAPVGTPPAVVKEIADSVTAILSRPDMNKKMTDLGVRVTLRGPEQLKDHVDAEIKKFNELVGAAKIKAE